MWVRDIKGVWRLKKFPAEKVFAACYGAEHLSLVTEYGNSVAFQDTKSLNPDFLCDRYNPQQCRYFSVSQCRQSMHVHGKIQIRVSSSDS